MGRVESVTHPLFVFRMREEIRSLARNKADLDWFLTARYTTQSWKPTPLVYVVLPQPPAQAMMNISGVQHFMSSGHSEHICTGRSLKTVPGA